MNLSGTPIDYLVAFAAGVLVSFTPCVYPLLPVSVGFIGLKAGGSRAKAFISGLVYASGIALTYSALGVIASLTGTIFGQFSSSPLVRLSMGVVFILFGLSLFDQFSFKSLHLKIPRLKGSGYFSVFLLGAGSALVISPCLTPILGSILFYLGTKKNLLYGATLLLSFAYGMSAILVLATTFSTLLLKLPKSGRWLLYVKWMFTAILLLSGVYFVIDAIWRMQ
jgi:thiol:disulfide interchange protein DsbD